MGEIEGIPDECPNCGAPKEEIYYWTEGLGTSRAL